MLSTLKYLNIFTNSNIFLNYSLSDFVRVIYKVVIFSIIIIIISVLSFGCIRFNYCKMVEVYVWCPKHLNFFLWYFTFLNLAQFEGSSFIQLIFIHCRINLTVFGCRYLTKKSNSVNTSINFLLSSLRSSGTLLDMISTDDHWRWSYILHLSWDLIESINFRFSFKYFGS
jgi:hypothetical protein